MHNLNAKQHKRTSVSRTCFHDGLDKKLNALNTKIFSRTVKPQSMNCTFAWASQFSMDLRCPRVKISQHLFFCVSSYKLIKCWTVQQHGKIIVKLKVVFHKMFGWKGSAD